MVWPRAKKFGMVTRGAWACFYGVSHPIPKRQGSSVSQKKWDRPTYAQFDLQQQNLVHANTHGACV